jgi:hypothetical protein
VTEAREVRALASLLAELEDALSIAPGAIGIELMIESPQALLDKAGQVPIARLVQAAGGRARAAHLGAYDLTASLGVSAADQRLDHPLCDTARALMQLALAETGVAVVDGATTRVAAASDGEGAVHEVWALHAANVRRALASGIGEGWDLHPSHLPARYGALFAFYLDQKSAMAARLRAFVERATRATRSGQDFDDAATGQGLLSFFLRGQASGALDEADLAATTLSLEELRGRSFAGIVQARASAGTRGDTP